MTQTSIKNHLLEIYAKNAFVHLLQMQLAELEEGRATITMPIDESKHTNLYQTAHGGALAALADTAMGVACSTTGKKVVTLEMNMNYIRTAKATETITAIGRVIHNGSRTMVAEAEIADSAGNLILKARGTFFVLGVFDIT